MRQPKNRFDETTIEGHVIPDPVVEAPVVEDERAWLDMNDAPKDMLVELLVAGPNQTKSVSLARWRITRRRIGGRWKVIEYWSEPGTSLEIREEPLGWRLVEGFVNPALGA